MNTRKIWNDEEKRIIRANFIDFIDHGRPYPNKEKVMKFFTKYPQILSEEDEKTKQYKLRIVLNNNKKLFSEAKNSAKKMLEQF